MDWKKLFVSFDDFDATFFEPASEVNLRKITENTGITVSGQLLDLLLQTDGIKDGRFGDYMVFSTDKVIEYRKEYMEHLAETENNLIHDCLFFADDGCGNHFGLEATNGIIRSSKIGVYYPISGEYRFVAPNLYVWANAWYTGRLGV